MTRRLDHRGPDATGVWSGVGVALGHTRLSILDLSDAGKQPMASPSKRWTVSYNGEIFNHEELRAELAGAGFTFNGHSDTEVLVAMLDAYGFAATLPRLVGMFAIAAWDEEEKTLFLGRDRAGQKPLFYGFHEGHFVFGSECAVLEAFRSKPPLDHESLALMLRYNSIPAPRTVYEGLSKLPPASFLSFSQTRWEAPTPVTYWSPVTGRSSVSFEEAKAETVRLLEQSVRLRMMGDVPVGAFMSGGIDSTLVVSFMQKVSSTPVRTFTIDFDDARFSEAAQARAIAKHLGTSHTELKVTASRARDLVPELGALCDEPFGDSSIVPTLLLSELTRRDVTVALTGDGGDELFGGYHRQIWLPRVASALRLLPGALRSWLGGVLSGPAVRARLLWAVDAFRVPLRMPDEKLEKLCALLLQGGSLEPLYRSSVSQERRPEALLRAPVRGYADEFARVPHGMSAFDRVCLADFTFYMPNDVLVKVDRASMRHGLEARSPFLDHRLVEHAFSLSRDHKVRGGQGKLLLRSILSDLVPASVLSAPKMGFAVPIAAWLRGELRGWVEDLLASRSLGEILQRDAVDAIWRDHLGGRDRHNELWNILMLAAWLDARSRGRDLPPEVETVLG